MTYRLAAQEAMLEGDTLEEKFAFAQSVGFDGIELSGKGGARADLPTAPQATATWR